jgi:membrane-associated phospholipid phosphatase
MRRQFVANTDVVDYRSDLSGGGVYTDQASDGVAKRRIPRLALACLLYALSAALLFPKAYVLLLSMNANRFVPFAIFSALLVVFVQHRLAGRPMPIAEWYRSYFRRFGMQALVCSLVFVLGLSAFSTYKTNIPNLVPFYADAYIAPFDAWLHGGQAWRLTHAIPPWMGGVVDFIYSRLWFLILIGTFTVVSMVYQGARLKRYLWATFLVYSVLGSLMAIGLSSVGPIYYDGFYPDKQFTTLIDTLNANSNIVYAKQLAMYLLAAERSSEVGVGTGISAMPSLHVAFAVLFAWLLTGWGRIAAVVGWLYAAFIMFGSVYIGWHYAVDGYLSAGLTSAIWIGLSRYYRLPVLPPRQRPDTGEMSG